MSDDRQQVRQERTRRSRRANGTTEAVLEPNGNGYADAQNDLTQLDDIINDFVSPSSGQDTVALGDDQPHDVDQISNEERVRQFRQQGGE